MDMKQTILTRRSCRSFTGEQITESECTALLEAANAAPVANGNYSDVKISVILAAREADRTKIETVRL